MLYELKDLRRALGVSQAQAAEDLDVQLSTYRNWEQCRTMPRDNGKLKELADYLGVSMEALFGYDLVGPGTFSDLTENQGNRFRSVPVFAEIAAGEPLHMWDIDRHADVPEEVMRKHPHAYLMRVMGDSVNRRILNGYYALIDPDDTETNEHDLFAVCVNGDAGTIKHVRILSNGLELVPDSYDPTIRPIVFDYNEDETPEVTIMGKVVYAVMPFDYQI